MRSTRHRGPANSTAPSRADPSSLQTPRRDRRRTRPHPPSNTPPYPLLACAPPDTEGLRTPPRHLEQILHPSRPLEETVDELAPIRHRTRPLTRSSHALHPTPRACELHRAISIFVALFEAVA